MSSLPAVLTGLVAAASTALPGVRIIKGEPKNRPDDLESVVVAWTAEDTTTELVTEPRAGLGVEGEALSVPVLLSVVTGTSTDAEMDRVIARCDEMCEALRAAIDADPSLGGRIDGGGAWVTGWAFTPMHTKQGPGCFAAMTVQAQAHRGLP